MGKNIYISNCYNEGNLYCYGYAPRVGGIEGSTSGYFTSGLINHCINNCTSIEVDNFSEISEAHIGSICSSCFGSSGEIKVYGRNYRRQGTDLCLGHAHNHMVSTVTNADFTLFKANEHHRRK